VTRAGLICVLLIAAATAGDAQRALAVSSTTTVRIGVTSAQRAARVTTLPLEEYVARVLAGEGEPRAADAAQQALAIAVRTFALANRNRHRREGYDLCDTTHCQVLRAATPATARAAAATAGRVLMHQDQPATIFYSAWCGGRSELASEVWPGAIDYAFEPAQKDDACKGEPEWTSEIATREVEEALREAGLDGRRLRGLRVTARNQSGRVARLHADGFTPVELSGHDFRMAIIRVAGPRQLKSTAFDVRRTSRGYEFTGRGYGHGVGLCVVGAGHRAAGGASADDILRFYYPGLRIEQITPALMTKVAPAPSAAPAYSADVVINVRDGDEQATLRQLVRRARDEIAAKAGVKAPGSMRLNVHPDMESFRRATGQPWWVSGATDPTGIDLAPLSILQQRGAIERTIRREVTHLLLAAALAKRPIWVREGAASYFADPAATSIAPRRAACPADDELLRPLSAGAHRDALARAEACFRKQIAAGRRWQDVR
jgi:stage II sporulation protein D